MNKQEYLKQIDEVIAAGPYQDSWASLSGHPVPAWYRNAKLGIFIHWGVYSCLLYTSNSPGPACQAYNHSG